MNGSAPGPAKVAVVKPQFGANGGFERHLAAVIDGLRQRGWHLTVVETDGFPDPTNLYGLPVDGSLAAAHHEFFRYMALMEQVQQLDLDRFDAVLTTQPPTFLVPHRRKVAIFYHQARHFYDLSTPFVDGGFVDPDVHGAAVEAVRSVEREGVADVRRWLAGSVEVAARLEHYWHVPTERIEIHHAPPTSRPERTSVHNAEGPVVNVGRVEWPKRCELFVNAVHHLKHERPAHVVGDGSRLDGVKALDAHLHADPDLRGERRASEPWMDQTGARPRWRPDDDPLSGRVIFEGNVTNERRDRLYEHASVVVAPAYREDYGLTAIEAMVRARPVIVCDDGGGLTELVADGVSGLVVEPRAEAMAEAVDRLVGDPDLAARLGANGHKAVGDISLDQAVLQVAHSLRTVLEH
ncbi:MAG: glycosyltransferase family 4 protein [Actinomycetota bacterium]